jgi:hypothetical protein
MDNTLQLVDDVLKERKIRWAYADGLYTLSMGSYPAFIQVESDHDIVLFAREEADDPETELCYAIEYVDTPFSRDDIWQIIEDFINDYSEATVYMNVIERHFSDIAAVVEEHEISYNIVSRLFDKYLAE